MTIEIESCGGWQSGNVGARRVARHVEVDAVPARHQRVGVRAAGGLDGLDVARVRDVADVEDLDALPRLLHRGRLRHRAAGVVAARGVRRKEEQVPVDADVVLGAGADDLRHHPRRRRVGHVVDHEAVVVAHEGLAVLEREVRPDPARERARVRGVGQEVHVGAAPDLVHPQLGPGPADAVPGAGAGGRGAAHCNRGRTDAGGQSTNSHPLNSSDSEGDRRRAPSPVRKRFAHPRARSFTQTRPNTPVFGKKFRLGCRSCHFQPTTTIANLNGLDGLDGLDASSFRSWCWPAPLCSRAATPAAVRRAVARGAAVWEPLPWSPRPTRRCIQPGRPGEPNTALTGAAVAPRPRGRWTPTTCASCRT